MNRKLFSRIQTYSISLLLVSFAYNGSFAAPPDAQIERLQTLSEQFDKRFKAERAQALEFAANKGLMLRRILDKGRVLELQRILPGVGPLFYTTNNLGAADTVSTDDVWPGGLAGTNLEGAGLIVGEWDGGAVHPLHGDLPRVTQMDGATEVSGHSTHVAGTLLSAGSYPPARGMAPAATLNAWDWNNDASEMATAASGLLLSNHSYGAAAGWVFIGDVIPNRWWWIGGSGNEDPKFGYYDVTSQDWDRIAYEAPNYLVVKAAGNDRTDFGPDPGEEYTIVDNDGNPLQTSTQPRPADCAPAGYDCLSLHSVAKNILTVGAVDDLPGGYSPVVGSGQVSVAPFSSWGPTDDGRIKPDLVANGVLVLSTWIDEFQPYAVASGTSMASPGVTGSLLLVQEHYEDLKGAGNFLSGAGLKALAIHTADEAGNNAGPDYQHGWGLLNTRKAVQAISDAHIDLDNQIIEARLADGETHSLPVQVLNNDSFIRATLVWVDPPGTPASFALDPADLMLVNDLDIRVLDGQTEYQPWVLDPASPASPATRGDNIRDNVEQVVTGTLGAGSYSVTVSHKGQLLELDAQGQLNVGGQNYSLIISVESVPASGSNEVFNVDFSDGLPAGWSVQTDSGESWQVLAPIPGDNRYDNLTAGNGKFAMIDQNYRTSNTVTSLRSPLMDLSGYSGAVLSFTSCFIFDLLETINVDISTDGGQSWSNVSSLSGFHLCPSLYSYDVSALAGSSTAMVRWRYSGNGYGNFWQIDNLVLDGLGGGSGPNDPPGTAGNPSPVNGAIDVAVNTSLSWGAATDADSHDVYFGTNPVPGAAEFQGNQAATSFDPGPLTDLTTYYWRIDEVNQFGTTAGQIWSFQTAAPVSNSSVHVAALTADAQDASRGRWDALVTVSVADDQGQSISNVSVDGSWSNGARGSSNCITDSSGNCTVSSTGIKSNVGSVVFAVDSLALAGYQYDATANNSTTITISKPVDNLLPVAVDDSYTTPVDMPFSENVMLNDIAGEAPTGVTLWDVNGSALGTLSGTAANGSFTYTPPAGFSGTDSFSYIITDGSGDNASAVVTITVGDAPPVERTLTLTTSRSKGNTLVTLIWDGFTGASVDIYLNQVIRESGVPTTLGSWQDNLGKGINGTYEYMICETGGTSDCASASVTF